MGCLPGPSSTRRSDFKLKDSDDPYSYIDANIELFHKETPNALPCVVLDTPPDSPCNDIWALDGAVNHSIIVDGTEYFVSFFVAPALSPLPNDVCAAAEGPTPCLGFTTDEEMDSTVEFLVRVTSTPISPSLPVELMQFSVK